MFFKKEPVTRLYFSTDIHGSERLIRKFFNAAKIYNVSILIIGGDITGKAIVPIVRSQGTYTCSLSGRQYSASTQAELDELHRLINYNGLYPRDMEADELEKMETDLEYRESIFLETVVNSVQCWLQIGAEKLKGTGATCYIMPGNDDPPIIGDILEESGIVINPEGKCLQLDERHEMISLGYSNPTPWNTERELGEEDLARRMEAMFLQVQCPENLVVNFHAPPFDSRLDTAPQLNTDFQIQTEMGQPILTPVGSKAVRQFIEKRQPLLGLHGHVHESDGMANIGRTLCINPGSNYTDGVISGAIIGLKKDGLATYQMVRG